MSLGAQDIFTKLNQSEADELLRDLAATKATLTCKIEALEDVFSFRINQQNQDVKTLTGYILERITLPSTLNFEAVISAKLKTNRYYLTGQLRKEPDGIYSLAITGHLFQLQRRQYYRVPIPESFMAKFHLKAMNQKPMTGSFVVHDISAGGCRLRLESSHPHIQAGDLMAGEFQMGTKPPLEASGEVRHVRSEAYEGIEQQFLGIQFVQVTPAFEKRVVSLVMELHRQFFTRRA